MSVISSSEQGSDQGHVNPKQSPNKSLIRWSLGEIRQGNLWPISVALVLVIASIFALSALAERMEQVIIKQGKDALTADMNLIARILNRINYPTMRSSLAINCSNL